MNTYYLVLEALPKDFMPIDINQLINKKDINFLTLENIDNFTKNYTKEELYKLIEDSNLVSPRYLSGELKIINQNKYRYNILYKDTSFKFDDFFNKYIDDKQMMNKFYNIYLKYSNDKENMKNAINNKNINEIVNNILNLSYENIRNIYMYILDNSNNYLV